MAYELGLGHCRCYQSVCKHSVQRRRWDFDQW